MMGPIRILAMITANFENRSSVKPIWLTVSSVCNTVFLTDIGEIECCSVNYPTCTYRDFHECFEAELL